MVGPSAIIDLVSIEDTEGTIALRATLEWWNCQVIVRYIATAQDMVDVLGGGTTFHNTVKALILMCHGGEHGIHMPELHPSVDAGQPYHGDLTPTNLEEFVRLPPGYVVINTGCSTGSEEFARAFFRGGCSAYIGPRGDPAASSSLFYMLTLCYEWLCRGQSLRDAHEKAAAHDDQTGMYHWFANPDMG